MSSPVATYDFLDRISQSGLLPEATIAQARIPEDSDALEAARLLVKHRFLTPFQAKALLTEETRSFFLTQRYKLLEHLGRGGMGDVYLAEHLLLRRVVAIKIILTSGGNSDTMATPGAIERFFREARAVATLDHPNVVRVFDMDRTQLGPCLVMEYVDGVNLHSLVKKSGPMPVARAVDAIRQAAAGLEHAHLARLIHRDVKPGNLLLDRMGTVKVVDLGLARHKDAVLNDGLTAIYDDNRVIGTADFQAPEQGLDSGNADARSDVYSLGAALFFLLTARIPFPGGSISNKLLAHQIQPPPDATAFNEAVPEELATVIKRMMAKRPVDRPQTMEDAWNELAPWAVDSLPPPTAAEMPKHPPSAYRLGLCPPPTDSMPQVTKLFADDRTGGPASRVLRLQQAFPSDTPQSYRTQVSKPRLARPNSRVQPSSNPVPDGGFAPVQLADDERTSAESITSALTKPLSRRTLVLGVGGGLIASAISGGVYWYLAGTNRKAYVIPTGPMPTIAEPTTPTVTPVAVNGLVLNGSGSSFVKRALDRWSQKYLENSGVEVKYQSIGSEKGVISFLNGTSRFACTEAFLTDEQMKQVIGRGDVVHIPLALGAVVPTYNLPTLVTKKGLQFTGQVLAKIFTGEIKRWNDDALAQVNPDVTLPDLPIKVVVRKDGSGTTAVFTDYLCKADPTGFAKKVGPGTMPSWPLGLVGLTKAEKNDGIAAEVNKTEGAIGYVELIYAKEKTLKVGRVQNKEGSYIEPDLKSVTAAAASLRIVPDDLRFTLTDPPGETSYPIVGCAWAVFHVRQADEKGGKELVDFFRWVIHDGQAMLAKNSYAPLPNGWIPLIDKKLDLIVVS